MDNVYQVSTLQGLALGYTRGVVTVEELLKHGNTGLGTFEDVNGEMIVVGGHCYRAGENGAVEETPMDEKVPFAAVTMLKADREFEVEQIQDIQQLKDFLNVKVEEGFGLNSMHIVQIDAAFAKVYARSETAFRSQHVELKEILGKTQKDFSFENISGSLVCVYFPDYMDGINAPGWHFHFVSEDRTKGGHVFELSLNKGTAYMDKIFKLEIQLPTDAAFDTYSLKQASADDIKKVEQGTK